MRLLVITREFPGDVLGGISYHLANLYNEVADAGHKLTVVTGTCPQSKDELADEAPPVAETHRIEFGYRKGYYVLFPLALRNFLRSFDTTEYDACLAHTQVPFEISPPLVTKQHDSYRMARPFIRQGLSTFGRVADSAMDPFRKVIDRRSLIVSDHLIFNSEVCRRGWQTHYDFDTPSSVSHNGVDTDQFSPREPSPLTPDEYVLFVGNDERKGLSTVLEYARESAREVVLVGPSTVDVDGATALGRLTPDELAAVYSGATATVHPTGFEAFGNVILESVACGTPVVTTDMCGAAEVLNADCGVITDDLHTGVDRASTLDSADCVAAVADQTWADVADETMDIIESAIDRTR